MGDARIPKQPVRVWVRGPRALNITFLTAEDEREWHRQRQEQLTNCFRSVRLIVIITLVLVVISSRCGG